MPNDPEQNMGTQDITISIPDSVKKNLPRDFNLDDIGKIDLREAEKIANEDILFLNEKDLAEGLEDFDLIPLKDAPGGEAIRTAKSNEIRKPEIKDSVPGAGTPSLREALLSSGIKLKPDEESVLPLDTFDEKIDSDKDIPKKVEPAARLSPASSRIAEGFIESDDEYVIWDMPGEEKVTAKSETKKTSQAAEEKIAETEIVETKREPEGTGVQKYTPGEDDVTISVEDLDEETPPLKKAVHEELIPLEEIDIVPLTAERHPTASAIPFDLERKKQMTPLHGDDAAAGTGEVFFIDDKQQGDRDRTTDTMDESGLEKIVSGIVQADEGSAYVLCEADVQEDRERIAVIADEFRPAYEDFFVDLDYKYGDEELDYIHTAIVEEDYGSYIREIDEFFGSGSRTVPAAVELLGLTADEFDTIEDLLFQGEFKDINMYDRYRLYEFDRTARGGSSRERKNCRYLLPDQNSLIDVERDSIESDVSSNSALIFEEDVEDIKEKLMRRIGKADVEAVEMLERAVREEIVRQEAKPGIVHKKISQITPRKDAPAAKTAGSEVLFDITDRVVILNDEADVERFVSEFPPRKRVNIKMLLKYLDGLFERLPEEIIKKFASSEYFDLYLKVLNELGV
jgi:hypothetical protein